MSEKVKQSFEVSDANNNLPRTKEFLISGNVESALGSIGEKSEKFVINEGEKLFSPESIRGGTEMAEFVVGFSENQTRILVNNMDGVFASLGITFSGDQIIRESVA